MNSNKSDSAKNRLYAVYTAIFMTFLPVVSILMLINNFRTAISILIYDINSFLKE